MRHALGVHVMSLTIEHETPPEFFKRLDRRWRFTLDVCASRRNAKCPRFYTRKEDGLAQPWSGVCWLNPPYGRTIGTWVQKAAEETERGAAVVVALLPARTDTSWWHEWVMPFARITFIRGRLKFSGMENGAPFPSALAYYPKRRAMALAQSMADPRQLTLGVG